MSLENYRLIILFSFLGVLFYYPLSHFSLMGMETGLVTIFTLLGIFFVLLWQQNQNYKYINISACTFGLAFLTRNDVFIIAVPLFAYLYFEAWKHKKGKDTILQLISATGLYSIFVIGQVVFRLVYYGYPLPNTYYLKVSVVPITVRINDGLLYVYKLLKSLAIPIILALISIIQKVTRIKTVLFALFLTSLAYVVWTGGDIFGYGRFVVPLMPIIIILASATILFAQNFISTKTTGKNLLATFSTIILFAIAVLVPFWQDTCYQSIEVYSRKNRNNMDSAIAIAELTDTNASIGVYYAGLIPYYTGRYAIDFLGKSGLFRS